MTLLNFSSVFKRFPTGRLFLFTETQKIHLLTAESRAPNRGFLKTSITRVTGRRHRITPQTNKLPRRWCNSIQLSVVGARGTPNYYLWGSRGSRRGIMVKFREDATRWRSHGVGRERCSGTRVFARIVVRDNSPCSAMTLVGGARTVTRETR